MLNKINEDTFNLIKQNLDSAKEKVGEELKKMKQIHNNVVETKNKVMNIGTSKHFSNTNEILYNQLQENFAGDDMVLDCFYKFRYDVGDYANPHYDSYSNQTSLLLLSDEFTGGNFILDGNDVGFNEKGTFISFDSKKQHSVSKILSGYREVLVMLFKKNKTIL